MAVDASGFPKADADKRSLDVTGLARDRVRKLGKRQAASPTEVTARTVDEIRTHAVETVTVAGFAVPVAAEREIRRPAWLAGYDMGWDDAVRAVTELAEAERAEANAGS